MEGTKFLDLGPTRYRDLCTEWSFSIRWSMKQSDLLIILAVVALVKPCFLRNNVNTAFASSLSAVNKLEEIGVTFGVEAASYSPATELQSNKEFQKRRKLTLMLSE